MRDSLREKRQSLFWCESGLAKPAVGLTAYSHNSQPHFADIEAATFHRLPRMEHKDPFDRLIIWQSIARKLTLISRDRAFADYKKLGLKVTW